VPAFRAGELPSGRLGAVRDDVRGRDRTVAIGGAGRCRGSAPGVALPDRVPGGVAGGGYVTARGSWPWGLWSNTGVVGGTDVRSSVSSGSSTNSIPWLGPVFTTSMNHVGSARPIETNIGAVLLEEPLARVPIFFGEGFESRALQHGVER